MTQPVILLAIAGFLTLILVISIISQAITPNIPFMMSREFLESEIRRQNDVRIFQMSLGILIVLICLAAVILK